MGSGWLMECLGLVIPATGDTGCLVIIPAQAADIHTDGFPLCHSSAGWNPGLLITSNYDDLVSVVRAGLRV